MNKTTLNRAYGELFGREQWDYFSTLTYKYPKSVKRNRIEMSKLTKYLKKQALTFSMIWVTEWHRSGSSTHSHLLTKGVGIILVDKYWYERNLGYSLMTIKSMKKTKELTFIWLNILIKRLIMIYLDFKTID